MKPKRTHNTRRCNIQGKGVTAGYETTQSHAKSTPLVSPCAKVKPFAGKVFYLDLPTNRVTEALENDIKDLGGTVEKFFSKDIRYLVSNKREAKYVRCLGQESPVPNPYSGQSSPHPHSKSDLPANHGENHKNKSRGQTDTLVSSRGKSLVERVVKEQERVQMNKILSNALEWGVKILYLDDVINYVQKKKKVVIPHPCPAATAIKTRVKAELVPKKGFQKCKGGRISKPFIKIEDSSRHYRPIYLTMSNMPQFNLKAVPPCSPFIVDDKDAPGNKQWGHRGVKASVSEERAHGRKKNRDKKRGGGYCECCMVKYESITTHQQSERHKAFSKSDKYFVVDKLVSNIRCNFLQIRSQVKRRKCSVSSVKISPGPLRKPEQRYKKDLDGTQIIKEVRNWTTNDLVGAYQGHGMKTSSVPVSARLISRKGDLRINETHADRSQQKSPGCKWLDRQNSVTSCARKAPQRRMETAPSRGECFASLPLSVTQNNQVDQMNMNSSTSHFHNTITQNQNPSISLHVPKFEQDDTRVTHDSPVSEPFQDVSILCNNISEDNHSEEEEANQHFRKIQRKVRGYKRKRRKVETAIPDRAKQKLWELFLSSDDMDVEFLGFDG